MSGWPSGASSPTTLTPRNGTSSGVPRSAVPGRPACPPAHGPAGRWHLPPLQQQWQGPCRHILPASLCRAACSRLLGRCPRTAVLAHPAPSPLPPVPWLRCSGKALESLRHATHVLSTVPPDAGSGMDPVVTAHAQQLSERADGFRWAGYISSTSGEGRRLLRRRHAALLAAP